MILGKRRPYSIGWTQRQYTILAYKTLTISATALPSRSPNQSIRVLASARDSFISISEFDKRMFFFLKTDEFRQGIKDNTSLPKRILHQETKKNRLKPLYFLKVNKEVENLEAFFVMALKGSWEC